MVFNEASSQWLSQTVELPNLKQIEEAHEKMEEDNGFGKTQPIEEASAQSLGKYKSPWRIGVCPRMTEEL